MEPLHTAVDNAGSRSGWLGRYFDAGLTVPEDLSPEVITGDEIARLMTALSIVSWTAQMKKRLGNDATREELAIDKKRARRTAWALKQSLLGWTGKIPELPADEEVQRAGAQIVWEQFKAEHGALLNNRLRLVATWSLLNEQIIFGNRAVVKLNNELNWVSYALRD